MIDKELLNIDLYDFSEYSNDASASSFGYLFQANAGLFLFMDYANAAKEIKIEGSTQDIDITLKDDSHVYAQAKSAIDYSKPTNTAKVEKYYDAMISLMKTYGKDRDGSYIYVSNLYDTFNQERGSFENNLAFYYDCPEIVREDIDVKINNLYERLYRKCDLEEDEKEKCKFLPILSAIKAFPRERLGLLTINYYGDDPERRNKHIKKRVLKFLIEELKMKEQEAYKIDDRLLEHWQNTLMFNSTTKKCTIKVADFVWPTVVFQLDVSRSIDVDQCCTFTPNTMLKNKAEEIIFKNEKLVAKENFSFSNKVISDFLEWKNEKVGTENLEEKFIKENGNNYAYLFKTSLTDEKEEEYLTKCMLARILANYRNIKVVNNWMAKKHGY